MATALNMEDSSAFGPFKPWAGILVGFASWIAQGAVCLWLMSSVCNQGPVGSQHARAILLVATIIFAVASVAGWSMSLRSLKSQAPDSSVASFNAVSRPRYTLLLGVFTSAIVTFAIALTCIPILALSICGTTR